MTNDEWAKERASVKELAFWELGPAEQPLVLRDGEAKPIYDLEERTARFGESIILFAKKIYGGPVNNRLIDQLVGAATSVGANYCEADDGVSRADFKHRIGTCRKEARETKFFLRMLVAAEPQFKSEARDLWTEAHALRLIFSRIWRSTKV